MTIKILWSFDFSKSAIAGFVGVTDVVAASYNIILLLKKAKENYIVRDNKAALEALKNFPGALLIGESTESRLPFVASNSPIAINKLNLGGKTAILKTNNGTVVVAEAFNRGATDVFGFHWANLQLVADWIGKKKVNTVTLIASGGREDQFKHVSGHILEDWYCAVALKEHLEGNAVDYKKYFSLSRKSINEQYPPGDPSAVNLDIILRGNSISGVIPVFSEVGNGIYKVANAI